MLDLVRAAKTSKAYAKLDASAWPDRVPPAGRQVRGGPSITLRNMARNALRVNARAGTSAPPSTPTARRGGRGAARAAHGPEDPSQLLTTLCTGEAAHAGLKMSAVAVIDLRLHASGKEVLYDLTPFSRWAARLHRC